MPAELRVSSAGRLLVLVATLLLDEGCIWDITAGTYVYVRQSTLTEVQNNFEPLAAARAARARGAVGLGCAAGQGDRCGPGPVRLRKSTAREGFKELVADVGLGRVGIIFGIGVSRLARNNSDWCQLLDLCALTNTLIADSDGVYHPAEFNGRVVLGSEGHHERGRAASDPVSADSGPASQGGAGRAVPGSSGRLRLRPRTAGSCSAPDVGRGGGDRRTVFAPIRSVGVGPAGVVVAARRRAAAAGRCVPDGSAESRPPIQRRTAC